MISNRCMSCGHYSEYEGQWTAPSPNCAKNMDFEDDCECYVEKGEAALVRWENSCCET